MADTRTTSLERPSVTALGVAVGLLLDEKDPAIAPLFPPRMKELQQAAVAAFPKRGPRAMRMLQRGWVRGLFSVIERATAPGIFLHYLMRKRFIEDAVRSALGDGARQL